MHPEKIIGIKKIGVVNTIDIEIDNKSHTFYGNGIATSNSHALSYAVNGYRTAYAKAHFPVQFFTSWLAHAKFKQKPKEEMAALINESKLFDIKVLNPDITKLNEFFSTDGIEINFGLSDIKGVGQSKFKKIVEIVKEAETKIGKPLSDFSWYEFLVLLSHKIPSIEEIVSVGGISKFYKDARTKAIEHIRIISELSNSETAWISENYSKYGSLIELLKGLGKPKKEGGGCANKNRVEKVQSIIKLLENPPTELKDSIDWVASMEESLIGIPISCSRIDDKDISSANCSCKDFISGMTTDFYAIAATLDDMRIIKVKNGKNAGSDMAYLTISDGTCVLSDVVIFSESYEQYKNVLNVGATLLVTGIRDRKRSNSLIVQTVSEL